MFGPSPVPTFSLTKIIGGLSKTLGVVNQMIPLYKEAKPLMTNARNALGLLREMSNTTTKRVMENTEKNLRPIKEQINNYHNFQEQKGPTFFL